MFRSSFFLQVSTGILISALALSGCNSSRSGGYPDTSPETQARADLIRADAQRRTETVARNAEQQETALRFKSKQISEKARQDRELIAIKRDKEVQPLQADLREQRAKQEREIEQLNKDTSSATKNADGPQKAELEAEAERKRSELKLESAKSEAELDKKIQAAELEARTSKLEIDSQEAKDLAAVERGIEEAQRKAREDKLAIEQERSKQLDDLSKESAKKLEATQKASSNESTVK